mmetsp:Transcript_38175/g.80330  ORF Transcript_38175/g.80330 Transcript_38175/m.80330 type:complete len:205 (+) Transcript_38175:409-1023(+)
MERTNHQHQEHSGKKHHQGGGIRNVEQDPIGGGHGRRRYRSHLARRPRRLVGGTTKRAVARGSASRLRGRTHVGILRGGADLRVHFGDTDVDGAAAKVLCDAVGFVPSDYSGASDGDFEYVWDIEGSIRGVAFCFEGSGNTHGGPILRDLTLYHRASLLLHRVSQKVPPRVRTSGTHHSGLSRVAVCADHCGSWSDCMYRSWPW